MFDKLGVVFLTVLNALGELVFAKWFKEQYLTSPWDCWFVMVSGLPGLLPNNNPVSDMIRYN